MISVTRLTAHAAKKNFGVPGMRETNTYQAAQSIPVKSAKNVIAAASQIKPGDLCDSVGLDLLRLDDPLNRIPVRQLVALYESAARLTRDPAFGLHAGERTELHSFDLLGYIAMNSATLGEALHLTARYLPIWTDGARLRLDTDGSVVRVTWGYLDESIGECRQGCEMSLLTIAKISRRLFRITDWAVRAVHFQHSAPGDTSEHRRLFRAPVYFHREAKELILDRAKLRAQLKDADRRLCDVLIGYAEHLLTTARTNDSLVNRTQATLRRAVLNGDPQLKKIAREMGIGTRTLQRKLKQQGASFRDLFTRVRRELAEQYLSDTEMDVSEIAYLLAYSQPSEFHRAFRAWAGTTPQRYRRLISGDS